MPDLDHLFLNQINQLLLQVSEFNLHYVKPLQKKSSAVIGLLDHVYS